MRYAIFLPSDAINSVFDTPTVGVLIQMSTGRIFNSVKGIHVLAGTKDRTPGHYFAVDGLTGRPTTRLLENTNEYMHASVRVRFGLANLGPEDRGSYNPPSLKGWTLRGAETVGDGSTPDRKKGPIWWQYEKVNPRIDGASNKLYEDDLGELELELLRHDSSAFGGSPPRQYAERLLSLQPDPIR